MNQDVPFQQALYEVFGTDTIGVDTILPVFVVVHVLAAVANSVMHPPTVEVNTAGGVIVDIAATPVTLTIAVVGVSVVAEANVVTVDA